jgi:hypothetical protein
VHDLLGYLYPAFNEDQANYPNVEDFLNLVEVAKVFHSRAFIARKKWSYKYLDEVMGITLRAVTEYIWDFMADPERRRALAELVSELVRPGDVVISFNWDFMIDLAIEGDRRSLGSSYTYRAKVGSAILLKPHGSIDWFLNTRLRKDRSLRAEMRYRAKGLLWYPYFHLAENPDLLDSPAFIVPPLSAKEYPGFLKRVWRDVFKAVAGAAELYIIGYSLPREDQFARLVIGQAIQRNNARRKHRKPLPVEVVNPDEGTVATFTKLVGPGGRFRQATLQDYLSFRRAERE